MAAFLESQPEIRDLSLRGMPVYTSSPFTLQPSALPHLETFRSVHVDPDTLREVPPHLVSFIRVKHGVAAGDRDAPRAGHLALPLL